MKIYLNAQFSDGNHRTHLLSLGMVSELGEWYRVFMDANGVEHALRNPWVREHVLTRLPLEVDGKDWFWDTEHPDFHLLVPRPGLCDDLMDFVDGHPEPELWAWQGAYAYVAVRHLFGKITERPANFPAWCGELAGEWSRQGKPELPARTALFHGHHALEQARWARVAGDTLLRFRPES